MIIASAIKCGRVVYLGQGHSHIIENMLNIWHLSNPGTKLDNNRKLSIKPENTGFYTDKGWYLTREEAKIHAIKCGQLKEENMISSTFTSEDIWDQLDPAFVMVILRS